MKVFLELLCFQIKSIFTQQLIDVLCNQPLSYFRTLMESYISQFFLLRLFKIMLRVRQYYITKMWILNLFFFFTEELF